MHEFILGPKQRSEARRRIGHFELSLELRDLGGSASDAELTLALEKPTANTMMIVDGIDLLLIERSRAPLGCASELAKLGLYRINQALHIRLGS
jgi:hypothetical protein